MGSPYGAPSAHVAATSVQAASKERTLHHETDETANDDIDNPTNISNEEEAIVEIIEEDADDFGNETHAPTVTLFGSLKIQERILGILAALFITGIWGGSVMVPMQFSPSDCNGLPYLTSFSNGATLVTLLLWLIRYLYQWRKHKYSAEEWGFDPAKLREKMLPYTDYYDIKLEA